MALTINEGLHLCHNKRLTLHFKSLGFISRREISYYRKSTTERGFISLHLQAFVWHTPRKLFLLGLHLRSTGIYDIEKESQMKKESLGMIKYIVIFG